MGWQVALTGLLGFVAGLSITALIKDINRVSKLSAIITLVLVYGGFNGFIIVAIMTIWGY